MTTNKAPITILMADDDDDDYVLTKKALKESKLLNTLVRVKDGEELLDYLFSRGDYEGQQTARPGGLLLVRNMPRLDGRVALEVIISSPEFVNIPISVFTTSKAEEDIYRSYQLGSNSFITKPVTFENLITVMKTLGMYWFEIVELPNATEYATK